MRVLIVDDTRANVELLDQLLSLEGFETLTAADGRRAREIAGRDKPDMILLDVMMPGESGFETCAKLKSDPETVDIPILFLSALDDVRSKIDGFKAGGVDYISKPVHGEEVLARVRVHLRILETNRALAREHKARLEEFRTAQQAILVRPEDLPEACFAVRYLPLEGAGGDFYDVVEIAPDVYGYFVADVSGHGVSAAFLTSAIKALLRQYSGPLFSPEDTMRGVDRVMRQILGEEQYLTACYALLNRRTGRLSVVSAGHPPLLVARAGGGVEVVEMKSDPLGIFSSLALQRQDLQVSTGDRFVLYSDGVIEMRCGAGRKNGLAALAEAVQAYRGLPLEAVPARVMEAVRGSGPADDDLLLLVAEVAA
ncbi:MAG: PP2C family protein-serine/threonine phosphatase [Acidobacteriota bacterium]